MSPRLTNLAVETKGKFGHSSTRYFVHKVCVGGSLCSTKTTHPLRPVRTPAFVTKSGQVTS